MKTTTTAPGIPKIPTNMEVIIFKPIWKLKNPPIKLMIKIITPPIIELNINFKIVFNGTIKIFPIINKKNKHATKAIILFVSKSTTCPYQIIWYFFYFIHLFYTASYLSLFFSSICFNLSIVIPFVFDFLIK